MNTCKKLRGFMAVILALVMCIAMLPTAAFAADAEWEISKSKEATALDSNYESQVTLSLPAASYSGDLDVVFVLDGSTSHDNTNLAAAAATLLEELAEYENLDVKVGVIVFGGYNPILKSTELLDLESNLEDLQEFLTTDYKSLEGRSGSNLQAGVEKARDLLNADTAVDAGDKYMIILTDGGARMWYDSDSGEAMSDAYAYGTSVWWNSNEDWCNRYGVTGTESYVSEAAPTFKSVWEEGQNGADIGKYGLTYSDWQKAVAGDDSISYASWETAMTGEDYYTTYEAACYYAATSIVAASQEVNVCMVTYEYYSDTTYTTFTEEFKTFLEDYVTRYNINQVEDIDEETATAVFSEVKDELIQLLDAGSSVVDVIGYGTDDQGNKYDFDFVQDSTKLSLTVGGVELTVQAVTEDLGNYETARYTFGTTDDGGVYPFVLHYYQYGTDGASDECLVWDINTAVTKDAPVKLTYSVVLTNPVEDGVAHTGLYTNESATLYPVDTDGNEGDNEYFERPEVTYGGGKEDLPGLDKVIVTDEGEVDQDDVAAGDTVDYKLTSTVPSTLADYITYTYDEETNTAVGTVNYTTDEEGNKIYDTYTLTFHDQMDSNLAYNNDLKVYIGGTLLENTDEVTYYTVTASTTDGCTFEVSMDLLALYTADIIDEDDFGIAEIVVTFSATLSSTATAGAYYNTAWVVYPEGESEKDTVEVDTYKLSVFKYDQADGTGLEGATFTVYSDADCNTVITTITTGEDGYATLDGLDAGTYYLKEVEAPEGYVKADTVLTVTIPSDVTDYVASVSFADAPIPNAGGAGTTMYTIAGICILLAAGAIFMISRKKRENA